MGSSLHHAVAAQTQNAGAGSRNPVDVGQASDFGS